MADGPDTDRLLRRRLYLQRYVTALRGEVGEALAPGDQALTAALTRFVAQATPRTLAAFARQRMSTPEAGEMLRTLQAILGEQQQALIERVGAGVQGVAEREVAGTAAALATPAPSARGVAAQPVGGVTTEQALALAYARYRTRLVAELTEGARVDPETLVRRLHGTAAERGADGLLRWRDEKVVRPEVDRAVNGVATNARVAVYEKAKVIEVDFVATLDFRTCPRCYAAEVESPYELGAAPHPQLHPNCRCELVPHVPDTPMERPFVEDERSVKDIPVAERDGKIGRTRDDIEAFFARMSREERRRYLGPARAARWEEGKITDLKQLVDEVTGEPLRLDQLPD